MKKILLTVMTALVSLGMWAQPAQDDIPLHLQQSCTEDTWTYTGYEKEDVLVIDLSKSTEQQKDKLATYFKSKPDGGYEINHDKYKVVVIKGTINDDDIETLNSIPERTIDLQHATWAAASKAIDNDNVANLILPDGWTKEEVNAVGAACNNLGSCLSQGTIQYKDQNGNSQTGASVTAYVKTSNTLYEAMRHVYTDNAHNNKLGNDIHFYSNADNIFSKVKAITISGNPVARDFSSSTYKEGESSPIPVLFQADGHFKIEPAEADETTKDAFAAVDGTKRHLVGNDLKGAFSGASDVVVIDLEDANINETYNEDMTLSMTGLLGNYTRKVVIPTTGLKTIPADFLNYAGVRVYEICIPSNIENIKTRAFIATPLRHVWTTSHANDPEEEDENLTEGIKYDNGAIFSVNGEEVEGFEQEDFNLTPLYGSYTFSSNLKLIESQAFGYPEPKVKDVYVLALEAPECHVDAFNAVMYIADNAYNQEAITAEGIITRDAYQNGNSDLWMTMLHYPRQCVTPNIQRYTDPTREYSIATGMRDGKGGIIYFPTQSEFLRAYLQGTFGYVWDAWDPTRTTDGNNALLPEVYGSSALFSSYLTTWNLNDQLIANQYYNDNDVTEASYKATRTFYDTTADGQLAKPTGQGDYWNVTWEENGVESQLYPEMETVDVLDEQGNPVQVEVNEKDQYGHDIYNQCNDGNYTIDSEENYETDLEGEFVKNITATPNSQGQWVLDYTWVNASDGEYYHPLTQLQNGQHDRNNWNKYLWYGFVEDANGEYINAEQYTNNQPRYITVSEAMNQGFTNTNNYKRYSPGYVPFASQGEYDSNSYRGVYVISDNYKVFAEGASDYTNANSAKYNKVPSTEYREYDSSIDYTIASDGSRIDDQRYDVTDNGYAEYVEADHAGMQRYRKYTTYRPINEGESVSAENRYCPKTEMLTVKTVVRKHDYRGWHQFVLTAYAHNLKDEITPYRTYIADNDWWTICVPYDLTRAEMIKFFGNEKGTTTAEKYPYLSRLLYVVRDSEINTVSLYFSKNLLNYTYAKGENVEHFVQTGEVASDDEVVLHAGVPYMIRPNRVADENESFKLQWNIYKNTALYDKLKEAENLGGQEQMDLVEQNIYTVPAYEPAENGSVDITYPGTTASKGNICTDFTYTFVGTFYNSLLPQYCYFLGWKADKSNPKGGYAVFYYNEVPNFGDWYWGNETAIIMANWSQADGSAHINPATSDLKDPARWIVTGQTANNDIFPSGSNANKNTLTLNFDNSTPTGIAEMKEEYQKLSDDNKIYNISGQYAGETVRGLSKGVYIMNGKKVIIK